MKETSFHVEHAVATNTSVSSILTLLKWPFCFSLNPCATHDTSQAAGEGNPALVAFPFLELFSLIELPR